MVSREEEIKEIQVELDNLGSQLLGYKDLPTQFVSEILEEFSPLINSLADSHSKKFGKLELLDKDDFYNEFFLYIFDYSLRGIAQRSTPVSTWFPSIYRYFRNVLVNLTAKHTSRRNATFDVDNVEDIDNLKPDVLFPFESFSDPEKDLLYKDCICEVIKVLRKDSKKDSIDLKVFNILLWPSRKFTRFVKGRPNNKVTATVISNYLQVPYSRVQKSFKRIRFVVESA
ncbi:MAG: hypothetical protein FVQ80_06565 [Planctomycetes bacterium]|nr:hypothetical protein [Planctomycetota bacterium]